MNALGALSPIETARAALQEKIADFLAARSRLINLQKNPSLQIQGQARVLYAAQLQLEDRLYNEIMPKIQKVQSGTWDFSDIATLGGFTGLLVQQINHVNGLDRQAGNTTPGLLDNTAVQIGIPALLVGGVVLGFMVARN